MSLAAKIVKGAVLLGTAGIVLATVAPYIAMAIGISSPAAGYVAAQEAIHLSANPAWLGLFFGAFGAIDAALQPVFQKIFPQADDDKANAPNHGRSRSQEITPCEHECSSSKYRDYEIARRASGAAMQR